MCPQPTAVVSTDIAMTEAVERLEQCFADIYTQRMQDIPIVNTCLEVRATGFCCWQGFWLGTLVTPWFISLVLLPAEVQAAELPPPGATVSYGFPCGHFTFIGAYEETVGAYLTCSLLSPVLEIDNQSLALAIADEAMIALMDPGNSDASGDISNRDIERLWRAEEAVDGSADDIERGATEHVVEQQANVIDDQIAAAERPVSGSEHALELPSRRDLLRRLAGAGKQREAGIANDGSTST